MAELVVGLQGVTEKATYSGSSAGMSLAMKVLLVKQNQEH